VAQFHWRPDEYLALMRAEVPDYERLQDEAAVATGMGADRVLELGTGTGETARRVLELHSHATLVGVDASAEMLERASSVLPDSRVELRVGRLEDPLPAGPFDVVVSVLAVHHLDGSAKADLFTRAREVMGPGGVLVVGDVVVPEDPADAVTPIEDGYDKPSGVSEQLSWMEEAGFAARVAWAHGDLAVMVGELGLD
jgi:cyclopropane fatty-acyl-phospholipid synthase-like methyltransferase